MNRPDAPQAGFTLLELLVAITLLGGLTAAAYAGIRFGTLAWHRAGQHRILDEDTRAVERVLRQGIGRSYPRFLSPAVTDRTVDFIGDAASLAFVAPLPDAIEPGILARQRLFLVAGQSPRTLALAWRLDLPPASEKSLPETTTPLATAITDLRFDYFGVTRPRQDPVWTETWRGLPSLPALVRVRLWRPGMEAPWIDLVIETRSTTSTACVYDPSDITCRRIR